VASDPAPEHGTPCCPLTRRPRSACATPEGWTASRFRSHRQPLCLARNPERTIHTPGQFKLNRVPLAIGGYTQALSSPWNVRPCGNTVVHAPDQIPGTCCPERPDSRHGQGARNGGASMSVGRAGRRRRTDQDRRNEQPRHDHHRQHASPRSPTHRLPNTTTSPPLHHITHCCCSINWGSGRRSPTQLE
jgi:hypothetical protein